MLKNFKKKLNKTPVIIKSCFEDENYRSLEQVFLEINGKPIGLNNPDLTLVLSEVPEEECSRLVEIGRNFSSHPPVDRLEVMVNAGRNWIMRLISKKPSESQNFEKIVDFISFLLHKKFREEFIGDIKETRQEMQEKSYSKFAINTITLFRICSVIWAALRIRLSDLFDPEKENNK